MPFTPATTEQLRKRLVSIYGQDQADDLIHRVSVITEQHVRTRESQEAKPHWDETDTLLITYGDTVQRPSEEPLHTLDQFCRKYLQDAISIVHLLPFFPYSSDDGFSVIDYRVVDSELGKWDHISQLNQTFDLMFDFVLNHVSRESLWFADFMEHMPPGNQYFLEADPLDGRLLQVVRPRPNPLMVEIRTRHDLRHVWATFSKDQIDLNYANPDVLMQALDILLFYVRQGARVVRLDAVAFLWKELGTNCIHLPQTHEIIKLLRDVLDAVEPGVILLTETNVPHKENVSYFGQSDEAHMVYQFSLPPLVLHAIHTGSTRYLRQWLQDLEPAPQGCTFLNFTASHDGVGLRALEGIIPDDEVSSLLEDMRERGGFISTRAKPDGSVSPYELNISYFDAMSDPNSDFDQWKIPRFMLTQTLALSLQGVPAIYIHSLLATSNDHLGVEGTGRTRSINRRKWDCNELEKLLADNRSDAHRVFNLYEARLKLRRSLKAFHPDASQTVYELGDDFLCVERASVDGGQVIKALFNFSPFAKVVSPVDIGFAEEDHARVTDLISGESPRMEMGESAYEMVVPGYASFWLTLSQA